MEANEDARRYRIRRYRLQVQVAQLTREARATRDQVHLDELEVLKEAVDAAVPGSLDLNMVDEEVLRIRLALGVPSEGVRVFPKWLKLLVGLGPVVILVAALLFVLERRRRKNAVSEEAISRLEAQGPTTET